MKTKYKNLKELREAIDSDKIEGSKLSIVLDNDHTGYYYDNGTEEPTRIKVESAGNGYYDYQELYEIFFPTATVENC